jgi:hypothetical protein
MSTMEMQQFMERSRKEISSQGRSKKDRESSVCKSSKDLSRVRPANHPAAGVCGILSNKD